jgi:hypothetical protein
MLIKMTFSSFSTFLKRVWVLKLYNCFNAAAYAKPLDLVQLSFFKSLCSFNLAANFT